MSADIGFHVQKIVDKTCSKCFNMFEGTITRSVCDDCSKTSYTRKPVVTITGKSHKDYLAIRNLNPIRKEDYNK